MAHIPHDYLTKKGRQWRSVKLIDIVTFLYHVTRGGEDPEVGFEDIHETVASLTRRLNQNIMVDPSVIESCLWSCNLMNEQGKFWDTKGRTFDQFVKDVLGSKLELDRMYNVIEETKKND